MSLPNIIFVLQLIYCVVKVTNIAHTTSRNACAANIVIEWLSKLWQHSAAFRSVSDFTTVLYLDKRALYLHSS